MQKIFLVSTALSTVGASAGITHSDYCDQNGYGLNNECVSCTAALAHLVEKNTRYGVNFAFGQPELSEVSGQRFNPMDVSEFRFIFANSVYATEKGRFFAHAECVALKGSRRVKNLRVWFYPGSAESRHPLASDQTRYCKLGDTLCEKLQPMYVNALFGASNEE